MSAMIHEEAAQQDEEMDQMQMWEAELKAASQEDRIRT